jgi:hypothetical protein
MIHKGSPTDAAAAVSKGDEWAGQARGGA